MEGEEVTDDAKPADLPEPVAMPDRRDALLLAARCCDSIDAPDTWDEDDHRWRLDTHAGKFYGATLDEALIDFWRSALRSCDHEGNPTEPDPFDAARTEGSADVP